MAHPATERARRRRVRRSGWPGDIYGERFSRDVWRHRSMGFHRGGDVLRCCPCAGSPVSRPAVPGIVSLGLVTGVALVVTSDALGLYDRIPHWGKLVHGVEAFIITAVGGLLLLG